MGESPVLSGEWDWKGIKAAELQSWRRGATSCRGLGWEGGMQRNLSMPRSIIYNIYCIFYYN